MRDGSFPDYVSPDNSQKFSHWIQVDADEKRSNSVRKKSLGFNSAKKLAYLRALEDQEEVNNNSSLMKIWIMYSYFDLVLNMS
jgi:hypothetical protein